MDWLFPAAEVWGVLSTGVLLSTYGGQSRAVVDRRCFCRPQRFLWLITYRQLSHNCHLITCFALSAHAEYLHSNLLLKLAELETWFRGFGVFSQRTPVQFPEHSPHGWPLTLTPALVTQDRLMASGDTCTPVHTTTHKHTDVHVIKTQIFKLGYFQEAFS